MEEDEATNSKRGAKKNDKREEVVLQLGDSHCACCLKPFLIHRGVKCTECGARICKNKCSRLEQRFCNCWCCLFCYQQRTGLFGNLHWLETYKSHHFKSKSPWSLDTPLIYADKLAIDATYMARTALRKLVDRAVDDVCKLSNSENSASNNTCSSQQDEYEEHGRNYDDLLKTIIVNKIIEKSEFDQLDKTNNDSSMKQIEDISEINSRDQNYNRSLETVSQDKWNSEYDQEACKFTQTHKSESLSVMIEERIEEVTTSISDEDVKSDCETCLNFHKSHRVPFPELGMDIIDPYQMSVEETEDVIQDPEYTKIISLVDSWKDNWYFRKKNFKQSSKFVSMFVPNSNSEYRAMIGDKDIDETSDLSEYSTNSEEEFETELSIPIKNEPLKYSNNDFNEILLVNRKSQLNHASGIESKIPEQQISNSLAENTTKNNFETHILSLNSDFQSITSSFDNTNSNVLKQTTATKIISNNDDVVEEKFNITNINQSTSTDLTSEIKENIINSSQIIKVEDQQDSEYTEQDIFLTERHCFNTEKCNDNSSSKSEIINGLFQTGAVVQAPDVDNHCLLSNKGNSEIEIQLNTPPKPGSIAEREHKKWENATSIKNNPYSKENIQKRLLERKYVGPFNLSRFSKDCIIDNPIVSNGETKELFESIDSIESVNDVNCHSLNSNICNLEIQDKTEIIKSNSSTEQDLKLITTNQEENHNKSNCNISTNVIIPDSIRILDEPLLSKSTKNNEISEHERKNNKNEIHAKLNNQEQIVDGISEIVHNKQPLRNEKQNRSIRQVDLKTCAFEKNELPKIISSFKSSEQQVVNKLDIKPLAYLENSTVETEPINKLEDEVRKETGYKSNLIKKKEFECIDSFKELGIESNFLLGSQPKNNVILDKDISHVTCLKSIPCKSFSVANNEQIIENKIAKYENESKYQETLIAEKSDENQDFKDVKKSEKSDIKKVDRFSNNKNVYPGNYIQRKLSMPSVKKLVQVFDKKHQEKINSNLVTESKSNESESKGKKSQEIKENRLPRELHSLTARSLSKEFREGLRQIPNKTHIYNLKCKEILRNDEEKY